jgi:Sec-independent protein translocase protein TatA
MASKKKQSRIIKKIIKADAKGKNTRANALTARLIRVNNRAQNRAIGNSKIKNFISNKIIDPLRNVRGIPARSLQANALQAFPTIQEQKARAIEEGEEFDPGVIQTPQSYIASVKKTIVTPPPPTYNSQNMPLLGGNAIPPTIPPASQPAIPSSAAKTTPGTIIPPPSTSKSSGPSNSGLGPIVASLPPAPISPVSSSAKSTGSPLSTSGNIPLKTSGMLVTPEGSENPLSSEFDYSLTPEERALKEAQRNELEYYEKLAKERVSRDDIMRDALRQFQGEIDATNKVYADKISQAKLQGLDRLGSSRAENFNSGAENSSFGNAALERVKSYNTDVEDRTYNEKVQMLSQISSAARQYGQQYYEQKRAAKEAGLESYMSSLTNAKAMKEEIATNIAASILNSNIAIEEIAPKKLEQIAKDAGVTVQSLKTTYKTLKDEADAEAAAQAAAEAEAARKAALDSQFNLSEGQARYAINPETGEYELIASRAKTYAPSLGGGSGSSGEMGAVLADFPPEIQAAAQSIFDGKSKLNEYPSGQRLAINQAFATLYSAEGGNELAQGAYDAITNLETHPGMKGAIGAKSFSSLFGLKGKPIAGTQAAGFLKQLDTLKANIKLVNIKYLKGTGALSDAEGKTLEDAGTSLDPSLPESDFKEELERVKQILLKANNIATGNSIGIGDSAPSGQLKDPQTGQLFDASSLTEEEYQNALADGLIPA